MLFHPLCARGAVLAFPQANLILMTATRKPLITREMGLQNRYHFCALSTLVQIYTISCARSSPVRYAKFESIRYFIDIDILQNCLIDIDIFQNHHIDIDIDIFGIALSISISISIFSKMTISILISISIFFKSVDISTIDMSYRYIEQG